MKRPPSIDPSFIATREQSIFQVLCPQASQPEITFSEYIANSRNVDLTKLGFSPHESSPLQERIERALLERNEEEMNRVFDRIEHVSPDGWTQYYDRTNLFQNLERHYLEVYGDHPNFKKHLISTSLRELVENTPLYGSRKIEESEMEF